MSRILLSIFFISFIILEFSVPCTTAGDGGKKAKNIVESALKVRIGKSSRKLGTNALKTNAPLVCLCCDNTGSRKEKCDGKSGEKLKESFKKITFIDLEEEDESVNDYPILDDNKVQKIQQLISGIDSETVLISRFNLSLTRLDIQTLQWNPLTWLNDEVINFYMELLAERSRKDDNLPKVHSMNTFFVTRLLESGFSGVRRWTRKVDIFAHDIILIPVHKGVHWCMAIIHLKNKTIKYYDSFGVPNDRVLSALYEYLKSESLDKKKVKLDMSGWKMENVRNIPQQENDSDCGVFSCMYAEFVTRNRPIVFTQQQMQYFRMKMVYEICTGQMLN